MNYFRIKIADETHSSINNVRWVKALNERDIANEKTRRLNKLKNK